MKRNLNPKESLKIALIAFLIGGTLCLHYFTAHEFLYHHAAYQMLFYLPLFLATFWFGWRGAAWILIVVGFFYLPSAVKVWRSFSLMEFHRVLEGMLFVIMSLILGFLVERNRKQSEARIQAERFAAMGKAVAEIAHDMKSPLMAIGGFAAQLARSADEKDQVSRKKLSIIMKETGVLEAMVREMLDFAKPLEITAIKADLNEVVMETIKVAEGFADKGKIMLRTELAPSLPPLKLDRPRIRQAVLNLLTNAIQASWGRGEVIVKTHFSRGVAVLEVVDCGPGIHIENHEKVFEPFFSTRTDGTGLGLPNVKKIVEAHRGRISFRPNSGNGAVFAIEFLV